MKTLAKICIVLACAALIVLGAYVLSSNLSLNCSVTVVPASEAEAEIKAARDSGRELPGDLKNYNLVTLSVSIRSYSPFKAEWINLSLKGGDENAPVVSSNAWLRDLGAFSRAEGDSAMYISFLSPSDSDIRSAQLEYYIFGRYHSKTVSSGKK